jgi:GntR family transcriptional regulator
LLRNGEEVLEISREPLYYYSMTLRPQHDKPVYVRLRETISDAILAGKYGDGDPLPSVRALAAEEQANPLTVAKAYQGFQDEGLVVVKRGVGMFVAAGARARLSESERTRFLKEEWPEIRARMRRLGISAEELLERERA